MIAMKEHALIYQKFLTLSHTIDEILDFPLLSPDERCVIRQLNNYWINGQDITVVEAMRTFKSMASSTVFRHLKNLRLKGYLEMIVDISDNRYKYVRPTKQIESYFEEYGKALLKTSHNFS